MNILALAEVPQMGKSTFWRLRESRKHDWKHREPPRKTHRDGYGETPAESSDDDAGRSSDGRFHIPDEGAEAELVGPLIKGAKGLQQTGDEVGVNDGQDGLVHRRPSVRPEVWIARLGAASGDLSKSRVAAAVEVGQQRENVFVMGLIAGYKYSFHKGVNLWAS